MWDFIRDWSYRHNKCGMKIVDYDKMLLPQYHNDFEKTISKETFEALQAEAKRSLREETCSPSVAKHWESIANGEVPFGYVVRD